MINVMVSDSIGYTGPFCTPCLHGPFALRLKNRKAGQNWKLKKSKKAFIYFNKSVSSFRCSIHDRQISACNNFHFYNTRHFLCKAYVNGIGSPLVGIDRTNVHQSDRQKPHVPEFRFRFSIVSGVWIPVFFMLTWISYVTQYLARVHTS